MNILVAISKIESVLDGTEEQWKDNEAHFPVENICNAIAEIDGVDKVDDFESNGWQYDWWQYFTYKSKRYGLAGSGHYGGLHFYSDDDE